jgi:hypothetical protein
MEKSESDTHEQNRRAPIFSATCWYCGEPLNSMRRYCDKGCAEAFEEDDAAMVRHMHTEQHAMHG